MATSTGAVTFAYTGRPVEIITMVPAKEAHKYHKPKTRNAEPDNDSKDKMTKKNNEVEGGEEV